MSSDPLFPCCQSSVAGTSRFGIHSHARRYSDLAIPSSLKLLARAHCGDLAHHRMLLWLRRITGYPIAVSLWDNSEWDKVWGKW